MKNTILLIMLSILFIHAKAQNVNGVSTNPRNPINPPFLTWANIHLGSGFTQDPFLNRFDWRPVSPNEINLTDYIPVEYMTGFNIANVSLTNNQLAMKNPFNTGMDGGLSEYMNAVYKPDVRNRDFRWQDGWELLWMNLGYTPDMNLINTSNPASPLGVTGPNPVHAPYFVLYNRYKGTMRLFGNVWFNVTTANKPQKVITTLQFNNNEVNGLLRHNSSYDLALDNPTKVTNISGPTFNFTDQYKWLMSDFQVGFDPCICNRSTNNTKLNFVFSTLQSMDIDMVSRSISVQQNITDNSYLDDDFLNLNDIGPNMLYKPGSRIYGKMNNMLDGYLRAVDKYKTDLKNYNSIDAVISRTIMQSAKAGLSAATGPIGEAIANELIITNEIKDYLTMITPRKSKYTSGLIKLDPNNSEQYAKDLQKATKGIIGSGFDFLSTQLDIPGAPPAPPAPPVATFTETTFKGEIIAKSDFSTDPLLMPGALPKSYENGSPGVNKLNYPAYNEVLGLFALLETPKVEVRAKPIDNVFSFKKGPLQKRLRYEQQGNTIVEIPTFYFFYGMPDKALTKNYQILFKEPISYRINHAVDFNFNKTKIYYSIRVKLKTNKFEYEPFSTINKWSRDILNDDDLPLFPSIIEKEFFNTESYGDFKDNNNKYVVVSSPFTEIKNILNEPLSLNHYSLIPKLDILYLLGEQFASDSLEYFDYAKERIYDLTDYSQIESIELKLMADMYFLSPGSKGQELNTLQTFTYKIYENSGNDNQMPDELNSTIGKVTFLKQNENLLKHQSGNVVFDNIQISPATITSYTHHLVNATEMHIYVENAILKNNITVAPGYIAYIHFLGEALSEPETEMFPELVIEHIKSEDLYQNPLIYEATDDEVTDFCSLNKNKYQANTSLSKSAPVQEKPKEEIEPKDSYIIYPNPASGGEFNILLSVKENTNVTITLFDLTGKQVAEIYSNAIEKGSHQATFNTERLTAGVYLVTLNASNGYSETKKLIIAK